MQIEEFFHWLGEKLGDGIRLIVEGLGWLFGGLFDAIDGFIDGLTTSLGIDASWFSLGVLLIGLLLLVAGLRALVRRAVVAGLIWMALGLLVLSWLIY